MLASKMRIWATDNVLHWHWIQAILAVFLFATPAQAYSVLTHQAIVDSVWLDGMVPVLKHRFPDATEDQLREAHAYAYGGCIIQDFGYYPFSSKFFSDLVHYVRSADFVQALIDEARDVNELAFALGAVSHYGADVEGHSIAINKAVPMLYPELKKKFGDEVTFADSPIAHLKMEFGFDVLQVARGHYAPKAYHDFIGFEVSKDVLSRAFLKTYGIKIESIFTSLDLAFGTYRYTVSSLLPNMTKIAWSLKQKEILSQQPTTSRKMFLYRLKRSSFEKEWKQKYKRPGFGTRVIAFFLRLTPKFGSLHGLSFRVPTPATEKLFEVSFEATVKRGLANFRQANRGPLKITNLDLDTGKSTRPGEYLYTDKTYDKLLSNLAKSKFSDVTPELRANIVSFYARMPKGDVHGAGPELEALKASANNTN